MHGGGNGVPGKKNMSTKKKDFGERSVGGRKLVDSTGRGVGVIKNRNYIKKVGE